MGRLAMFITMAAPLLLQGCGPVQTMIPGVPIEPGKTATLLILGRHMALESFDGAQITPPLEGGGQGRKFTIPIGRHTITVERDWALEDGNLKDASGGRPPLTANVLEFDAQSNHTYRVQYPGGVTGLGSFSVYTVPYVFDLDSDTKVGKVVE